MPNRMIVTVTGPSMQDADDYATRVESLASFILHHQFLTEYRLDMINHPQMKALFSSRTLNTVATCRHKSQGGKFDGSEFERISILEEACHHGASYVDMELRHYRPFVKGNAKLILSHHDFNETPDNLSSIVEMMISAGADVAKIAVTPNFESDNDSVLELVTFMGTKIPLIGIAMGKLGERTRWMAPLVGAYATYACLDEDKAIAGQMTVAQLMKKWEEAKALHQPKPI